MSNDLTKDEVKVFEDRVNELVQKRERLNRRLLQIQIIRSQGEKERERLKLEMESLGTSPEKLDEDRERARKDLEEGIAAFEREMKEFEDQLVAAEKVLEGIDLGVSGTSMVGQSGVKG